MRFDFSHSAKMTDEEKQKAEQLVNEYIKTGGIEIDYIGFKEILAPLP